MIRTANEDDTSRGESFLTFDLALDATVMVAHDARIRERPAWLKAFADTDLLEIRSASAGAHALTVGPEGRAQWQVINVIIAIVLLGLAIAIPVMRRKRVLPVVTRRAS